MDTKTAHPLGWRSAVARAHETSSRLTTIALCLFSCPNKTQQIDLYLSSQQELDSRSQLLVCRWAIGTILSCNLQFVWLLYRRQDAIFQWDLELDAAPVYLPFPEFISSQSRRAHFSHLIWMSGWQLASSYVNRDAFLPLSSHRHSTLVHQQDQWRQLSAWQHDRLGFLQYCDTDFECSCRLYYVYVMMLVALHRLTSTKPCKILKAITYW